MNNHSNLFLSIGSLLGSAFSYLVAFATDYHIMAVLGFIGVAVSIWAGVLTVIEKRISIRYMREEDRSDSLKAKNLLQRMLRRKSGGRG
jgi:hypothetical protein